MNNADLKYVGCIDHMVKELRWPIEPTLREETDDSDAKVIIRRLYYSERGIEISLNSGMLAQPVATDFGSCFSAEPQ